MQEITAQEAKKAITKFRKASGRLAKLQDEKREKITPLVNKYKEKEAEQSDLIKEAAETVEAYAKQQHEKLFRDGKKTAAFGGAEIGFRTNPPSLEVTDEDAAVEFFKEWYPEYCIDKTRLDKKGILANLAQIDTADLTKAGITVQQEEKFYVKA